MIKQIKNAARYHFPIKWIFRNPDLQAADAFVKKNFSTGFHVQYFYEVVLITSGEGYHFIGNETVRALRGDCFVIPPGVRHAFKGGDGFDVWHFHINPNFFNEFMPIFKKIPGFPSLFEAHHINSGDLKISPDLKYRYIPFAEKELAEIIWALQELNDYVRYHLPCTRFITECKAAAIIHVLCAEYSKITDAIKGVSDDDFFNKSLSVMDEEPSAAHSIEELASIARMSRTTYVKKFREQTGSTPKQLLLEERISKAKKLLSSTDDTVIKIAEAVGFYDVSHFAKTFKKRTGMTPAEYRRWKRR